MTSVMEKKKAGSFLQRKLLIIPCAIEVRENLYMQKILCNYIGLPGNKAETGKWALFRFWCFLWTGNHAYMCSRDAESHVPQVEWTDLRAPGKRECPDLPLHPPPILGAV